MTESTTVQQPAGGDAAAGNRPAMDWWATGKSILFRMAITYFIFNMFRSSPKPSSDSTNRGDVVSSSPASNLYPRGQLYELYVYVSENESSIFADYDRHGNKQLTTPRYQLIWHLPELVYGDWSIGPNRDGQFERTVEIDCINKFPGLMQNGSLYMHAYFVRRGFHPDPNRSQADAKEQLATVYISKKLTRHKRRKLSRTVNLLTGVTDQSPDLVAASIDQTHLPPATHWHPNLTINIVDDHTGWTQGAVPPPLNQFIHFHPLTNEYYPIVMLNDYWNLNEAYQPVNETTPTLQLSLTFSPLSLFKWQLYAAQSIHASGGGAGSWLTTLMSDTSSSLSMNDPDQDEADQDSVKKVLLDTNPYLLAVTVVVSIVHCVFEFLAFKNDIQFWNSRESLEGLSVRSVLFNVFQSFIVLLYIIDNHTNMMITFSVLIGLGIEIWKIKKVMTISLDHENKIMGIFPSPVINYPSSYVESDTKKYDQMAFKYLSWVLFPMLIAYSAYSLVYLEHRGWYSWVLSMLYGFFLTFGFIMMTPQLFINYKLKSIAHLPWRMLTYKALNTFIDDLFAFVIHMPTLYRIGCLRDDVIFFVYVYQRIIYPIDPNRVNEFGVSKTMLDDRDKAKASTDSIQGSGGDAIEGSSPQPESSESESGNSWEEVATTSNGTPNDPSSGTTTEDGEGLRQRRSSRARRTPSPSADGDQAE